MENMSGGGAHLDGEREQRAIWYMVSPVIKLQQVHIDQSVTGDPRSLCSLMAANESVRYNKKNV